jgi:hypothetical protein
LKASTASGTGGQRTGRTLRGRLVVDRSGERVAGSDGQADPVETRNHAAERPGAVRQLRAGREPLPQP